MNTVNISPDAASEQLAHILKDYISRPEFCKAIHININTAEKWAVARKGPPVTIIARRAYYHIEDVKKWMETNRNKEAAKTPRQRGLR